MITASIAVSKSLKAALQGLKPEALMQRVQAGMERGVKQIEGQVTKRHLTGKGPFAVNLNKLGVRSGMLRKAVSTTKPVIRGKEVVSSMGSSVKYAHAHEFGGGGRVAFKAHQRSITVAFGRRLKAPKLITVKAHERIVDMPERAPFRTGIRAHLPLLENAMVREITTPRLA
jgi:phage gpG-like protein